MSHAAPNRRARRASRHVRGLLAPLAIAALLLGACGSDEPDDAATNDAATEAPASDAMSEGGETGSESMSEGDDMMSEEATGSEGTAASADLPEITATMADGSTITLADYAGEPLFVETFATWCSNCRRQLGDTTAAAAQAGDAATFLVLSVESDLDPARLDTYATDNGFEGVTFAVLDDQSLSSLADTFGNSVLVPPSTPKFTVSPDGTVGELVTGFESPEEILGQLDAMT